MVLNVDKPTAMDVHVQMSDNEGDSQRHLSALYETINSRLADFT